MSSTSIILLVAVVLYLAYNWFSTRHIQKISGQLAHEALKADKKVAQFIDVRTPNEYNGYHIKGFKNIPVDQLASRASELNKDKPVYVMCASGSRSLRACKYLTKAGYQTVYNVNGGISRFPR